MFQVSWLLVALSILTGGQAFLTGTVDCEAGSPCTCSDDRYRQYIHCTGLALAGVPTFHNSSSTHRDITLDLSYNDITTVKTYAFKNLNHTARLGTVYFHLQNNKIASIAHDAFMGFEHALQELDLQNNMLDHIPVALSNLTSLRRLDIRNNSITTYDPHTMTAIGKVLEGLTMGYPSMHHWPSELHYLRNLKTLNVYYTSLQTLPTDAFYGFSHTLQSLRLDSTDIGQLIPALCHLSAIKRFDFDNNQYYHGHQSIFEPCPNPLTTVRTLHLSNDNFQHFPPVFAVFPNITTLYIVNNPLLFYVDDSLIPANTVVQNLYLFNNGLTRVPEAVQKMQRLQTLDLHGNQIRLIETHDVTDMDALKKLRLDGNPIKYISSTAFQNLPQLQFLSLNGTSVASFPQAIATIPSIRDVFLPSDQISCDCSMAYLKTWRNHPNIRGTCEASTENINDFVRSGLHSCPSP